ncbi:MAG: hypothetical protein GXY85_07820 [Candidatus Brocadiaceae bacterium]|nr:hypothetical protein [Candidatus Brocadiaceae bacterium]
MGTDLGSSRRCVDLARRHPDLVRAAVGIHPTDWAACSGDFAEVERLAAPISIRRPGWARATSRPSCRRR